MEFSGWWGIGLSFSGCQTAGSHSEEYEDYILPFADCIPIWNGQSSSARRSHLCPKHPLMAIRSQSSFSKNLVGTHNVLAEISMEQSSIGKYKKESWLWKVFTYIPEHSKNIKNKLSRERHSMPQILSLKMGFVWKKYILFLLCGEKQNRSQRPRWSVLGKFVRERGRHHREALQKDMPCNLSIF